MAKKDQFDSFLEKQFGEGGRGVTIAKPLGGERSTSFEERKRKAEEEAPAAAGAVAEQPSAVPAPEEPARRPGRPKSEKKEVCPMNFLIERDLKAKLEILKVELYRSSVTDLIKEALHDLLVKYGRE